MALPAITEGWTHPLDVVLKVGGVPYAFAPADTVTLILKTQDGREIDTTGNVTVLPVDPAATPPITTGTVRFSPDAGDFRAKDGPYLARWKVTTATGVFFCPNDREAQIPVRVP